jgi:transcriptional regulator with XRE-family HTH domain
MPNSHDMARTHLGLALISATDKMTASAVAEACSVSQSTISRLMSSDRRIDVDTLHALCNRLGADVGTQILYNHLLDEITRAGRSTRDWKISSNGATADDLSVIESAINGDQRIEEMAELVHHLANLVRNQRKLAGKPPATTYPFPDDGDAQAVAEDAPKPPTPVK